MDTRELCRHALVDWMADHLESVERYPVRTALPQPSTRAAAAEGARGAAGELTRGPALETLLDDRGDR